MNVAQAIRALRFSLPIESAENAVKVLIGVEMDTLESRFVIQRKSRETLYREFRDDAMNADPHKLPFPYILIRVIRQMQIDSHKEASIHSAFNAMVGVFEDEQQRKHNRMMDRLSDLRENETSDRKYAQELN